MFSAFGLVKEPRWDPIRSHPEFGALVEEWAKADGVTIELPAQAATAPPPAKKDSGA